MRAGRAIGAAVVGLAIGIAAPAAGQQLNTAPALYLRTEAEELLSIAYPERYASDPGRLADDVEWVRDHDGELQEWAQRQAPLYLLRASDVTGLAWPYRDIEVYLVRAWPVVSIEHPLVLALDEVQGPGGSAEVPRDDDVQALLLAHQLVHYLLDDPPLAPGVRAPVAYDHPFLTPDSFELESMVNWVTYTVLRELWGSARLERATGDELWRAYNPSHDFVVAELMRGVPLTRTNPLTRWLAANPRGSRIFAILADYEERAGEADGPTPGTPGLSGTEYGIDLGGTYDGRVFVASVDRGSAADRAGLAQGDELRTIEGRAVGSDVVDAKRRLDESWSLNREINLSVMREGREVYLTVGS
jgi:hypothetical protein